jgi:hypothetical protein
MVRAAALVRALRHLSASSATTPTAPVHATINTMISTTWSSSAAAPRTAGAAFTASAAPTSTTTAVPIPGGAAGAGLWRAKPGGCPPCSGCGYVICRCGDGVIYR